MTRKTDVHSAILVFGEDDARRAGDARWAQMENAPHVVSFATEAELNAYLRGLDDGVGWMDYNLLTPAQHRAFLRARKRAEARKARAAAKTETAAP